MSDDEFDLDDLFEDNPEAITVRERGEPTHHVSGENAVALIDNGPSQEIEDAPFGLDDPLDVDENPFLEYVTDDDGYPGWHPAVQAASEFDSEQQAANAAGLDEESDPIEENSRGGQDEDVEGEDDFDERVRRDGEQRLEGVPDLLRMVNVRQQEQDHVEERAPYRRINPPTAYTSLLGGLTEIKQGQEPQQVAAWVGEDCEALPVTITWAPADTPPEAVLSGNLIHPFVRIKWGCRGARYSVDIDCGRGGMCTINASQVYVEVGRLPLADGAPTVATYRLTASVGFYTGLRTPPLYYTVYEGTLDAGDTGGGYLRPNFAVGVRAERDNPAVELTLFFNALAGTDPTYTRVVGANEYIDSPIPLSNDIVSLDVQNTGMTSIANLRVLWELGL